MPQTAFEATNSWCYHFARYEALPQVMRMPEVASGQPFRLVEFVKKVMNEHLTPAQQETKYARRDTGESLSIAATIKFYVPFVAKNTQQLVRLGGGKFRIPAVEDVDAEADEAAEVETALAGRLGEDWQSQDPTFHAPLRAGPLTAQIFGVSTKWVGWTRNAGEPDLRQREQELALCAAKECADPEYLYSQTDPFNNFVAFDATDATNLWRGRVREAIESEVVGKLCQRFSRPDGMREVASGDHKLGAWLVENKDSPLYSNRALTDMLVEALKREAQEADAVVGPRMTTNAELYLLQILFKTRQASWGGAAHARAIHQQRPDIIPTAWASAMRRRVPFRMQSSIWELRDELLALGVAPELVPEPAWLTPAA